MASGSASRVAAGLLHPLNPRGGLIWKGAEGLAATNALIHQAQTALDNAQDAASDAADAADSATPSRRRVVTCERILRPALAGPQQFKFMPGDDSVVVHENFSSGDSMQKEDAADGSSSIESSSSSGGKSKKVKKKGNRGFENGLLTWLDAPSLAAELSGVALPDCKGAAAITGGRIVDTKEYLAGLWMACEALGCSWEQREVGSGIFDSSVGGSGGDCDVRNGSNTDSRSSSISAIGQLLQPYGSFHHAVVCAGGGVRLLEETRTALCETDLVSFSRGQSVEVPNGSRASSKEDKMGGEDSSDGDAAPVPVLQSALLCGEYVVPVGSRLVLGATHERMDWRPDLAALQKQQARDQQSGDTVGLADKPMAAGAASAGAQASFRGATRRGSLLEAPPKLAAEVLAPAELGSAAQALWPPVFCEAKGSSSDSDIAPIATTGVSSVGESSSRADSTPLDASEAVTGAAPVQVTVPKGAQVTVGVRVLPRRSHLGKLPLAGRVPELPHKKSEPTITAMKSASEVVTTQMKAAAEKMRLTDERDGTGEGSKTPTSVENSRIWVLTGLGSRGLIHHAYLADCLGRALLDEDDTLLPSEVRPY